MYRLHYYPGNANLIPHILFEEIGVDYELVLVDRSENAQKSPEYMALNPTGRIPSLEDGRLVIFETAAICLHVCDRHAEAMMAPDIATPERAKFYQWLMFLTNTIQPEVLAYAYPHRHTTDEAGIDAVKAAAEQRLIGFFELVDNHLAEKGPYMMGKAFSMLDLFLFVLCRWGRNLATPPRDTPHLGALCRELCERPSVRRAFEQEGIEAPFV